MSYKSKTPIVVSILKRKLKKGKTVEDFKRAHLPGEYVKKNDFGYVVNHFGVPTRVLTAVSAEDPSIVYTIGLSYGEIGQIFKEAVEKSKQDAAPGKRGEQLDQVCEDMASPAIAFVAADSDYGGEGLDYKQHQLAKVTPEISQAVKKMLAPHGKKS